MYNCRVSGREKEEEEEAVNLCEATATYMCVYVQRIE